MDFMGSIFKPLSGAFFWLLEFLHLNLGISWAWSIVVLTVIVRVVLIPLTWRQLKSMRAMQALAPQIKELQEKYKGDREVLNRKTMEFYSENKVSPFGSCLPLILQMPVFIGLFYMLRWAGDPNAIELGVSYAGVFREQLVGWLWIRDITQFDIVLMFVYMASQFLASWQMSRKSPAQQKMIVYFMPVIVGIFMYIGRWPAGLFIYWVTSNVWTIAQQLMAEKLMPMPVAAVAAGGGGDKGKAAVKSAAGKAPAKTGTAKSQAAKTTGGKGAPSKSASGKAVPGKKTVPGKAGPGKTGKGGPGQTGATKPAFPKSAAGKPTATKTAGARPGAAKTSPAKARPSGAPAGKPTPGKAAPQGASPGQKPVRKSGGKSSVQETGKQEKATTGQGERPDGGAGGTASAG